MSSFDNDIEPTPIEPEPIENGAEDPARPIKSTTGSGTAAGLDEVGHPSPVGTNGVGFDGVGPDGEEQNPPLPDWGPTDGVHGTDAETAVRQAPKKRRIRRH